PASVGLSVSYVGTRGIHLWTAKEGNPTIPTAIVNGAKYWAVTGPANVNVPSCGNNGIIPTGGTTPLFCRVNPNWANTILHTTQGDSVYQGLQVAVNKRVSHGLQLQISYTWSNSIDDTEGQ